jgi:hypothetical protein
MAMFELVRFGCGQSASCKMDCGGPSSCKRLSFGDLEEAIGLARSMIVEDDPLSVIEVRANGQSVCTVGRGWISRKRPQEASPQTEAPPLLRPA